MSNHMRTRLLALAVPLLSGACGGPYTLPDYDISPVVWSSVIYAAKDGPILVEAAGSPGGRVTGALGPLVADYMTGAVIGYPTSFTADPTRAPHPNFRTVMVFNPAPSLTEGQACAGDLAFLAGPPPGRVTLFGAFCNGSRPLTSLRGAAEGVTGPTDPKFVALVRQATYGLFRPAREDDDLMDADFF
jgi:hypothetical protein